MRKAGIGRLVVGLLVVCACSEETRGENTGPYGWCGTPDFVAVRRQNCYLDGSSASRPDTEWCAIGGGAYEKKEVLASAGPWSICEAECEADSDCPEGIDGHAATCRGWDSPDYLGACILPCDQLTSCPTGLVCVASDSDTDPTTDDLFWRCAWADSPS